MVVTSGANQLVLLEECGGQRNFAIHSFFWDAGAAASSPIVDTSVINTTTNMLLRSAMR
jgi:hypothetical protein